jgi:hypothetical protein
MKTLQPINCCIYCGESDVELTDEHVIPLSLGGTMVLPKASCKKCAKQTAKLEGYVGRHIFQDVRIEFGLPTRRPKERPTHLPLRESFSPSPVEAPIRLIPTKDYPGALILVTHEPAGLLLGRPPEAPGSGQPFVREIAGRDRVDNLKKQNIEAKIYREIQPDLILRFMAKVALGVAVVACGLDGFVPFIRPLILTREGNVFHWIGGTTQEMDEFPPPISKGPLAHRVVAFRRDLDLRAHLLVQIQLFAFLNTPIYTAVVGRLTENGINRLG